jgi:hypothetical protein
MQRNVSFATSLGLRMIVMKQKVTITRTDAGATTAVMSSAYEWSKSYTSWDQALDEAVDLQLLNKVESAAAKMMPPGFPFLADRGSNGTDLPIAPTDVIASALGKVFRRQRT